METWHVAFPVVLIVVVILIMALVQAMDRYPCAWGIHKKRYIAIRELEHCGHDTGWGKLCTREAYRCNWNHRHHPQDVRWMCSREGCTEVGQECIDKKGIWKIEHGELVPDEKRLTVWQDKLHL